MNSKQRLNINRRSFLVGGALTIAGAGVALSGCNHKVGDSSSSKERINACLSCDSTNYNPVGNTTTLMVCAGLHVFESLYDYESKSFNLVPVLADGEPKVEDSLHYTVKIRDNAKFSDGSNVTAYDVVNAFETNRQSEAYKSYLKFIKSVQPVDQKNIKFVFNYAIGDLFKARSAMVRVYPSGLSSENLDSKPIGSGPWAYSSIDGKEGGAIDFVPNQHYNGPYSANGVSMHWTVHTDDQARISNLNSGSADVVDDIAVSSTKYSVNEDMIVQHSLGTSCSYLLFNTLKEPFGDKRVRQALHYAIDTDKLIKDLKNNLGSPASCILPTCHTFYQRAAYVYDYDPEKAKQLLKEAGAQNLSLTLDVDDDFTASIADFVKDSFEAVGVKCENNIADIKWNLYNESNSVLPFDVILASGDPSNVGIDPDLLMSWQYEDNVWMNGRTCFKKSNPEAWTQINTMMQAAREATNKPNWSEMLKKCFDKISEEVPVYPIYHREIATGYNPKKLNSFEPAASAGVKLVDVKVFG